MKNTKSLIALLLVVVMCAGLMVGCGPKTPASGSDIPDPTKDPASSESDLPEADDDLAYIQGKGTMVVGITDFAPMDFKNEAGEWIGFDADMAKAVGEALGVTVEFIEIDWDNKILELESKGIDCVWNGMTLTDEVKMGMATTNAYANNAQVVVVGADEADKYTTKESLAGLAFAVESGSAGEAVAKELKLNYTAVLTQADALMEVASGASDACIIDLLMAGAMIGEGTSYPKLKNTVELTTEEYGIGFRKGSNLVEKVNEIMKTLYADGTTEKIAKEYGVQEAIIAQ